MNHKIFHGVSDWLQTWLQTKMITKNAFFCEWFIVTLKDCKIHNHQKISSRPRRATNWFCIIAHRWRMFCFRNGNKMQPVQTCRICNNKKQILQHSQAFKYTNICDMLNVAAEHYFPGFFWMQKRIIWPTLDIFGFVCIFQKWPPSTTCQKAYAEMKDKSNSTLPYLLEEKGIRKSSRSWFGMWNHLERWQSRTSTSWSKIENKLNQDKIFNANSDWDM